MSVNSKRFAPTDPHTSYRPEEGTLIKSWFFQKKEVRLILCDDTLQYVIDDFSGRLVKGPIDVSSFKTLEEAITCLVSQHPSLSETGDVSFSSFPLVESQEKRYLRKHTIFHPTSFKSKLDNTSTLDGDHWAVTLVNSSHKGSLPKSWGGHAQLFIERVHRRAYEMYRAHLHAVKSPLGDEEGIVELKKIKAFNPSMITSQSSTWVRQREDILDMQKQIQGESRECKKRRGSISFNPRGNGSLGVSASAHNCFTWAKKNLELARVFLYEESDLPRLFKAPKTIIRPGSLESKERVLVQVEGDPLSTYIDITQEIDKQMDGRAWKLQYPPYQERSDCPPISFQAKYRYYFTKNDELDIELEKVEIPLVTDREKVISFDATSIIRNSLQASVCEKLKETEEDTMVFPKF